MHQHHGAEGPPHSHSHGGRFAIAIGLNLAFVIVEIVAGYFSESLALWADAGHNFGDAAGLFAAWLAYFLGALPPTNRRTFGWEPLTLLAAFANAVLLFVAVGGLTWEAIDRFYNPHEVASFWMIVTAAIGILVNGLSAALFLGHQHDLNLRGAYLHLVADALVSLGVVFAGVFIAVTGYQWVDPLIGMVIGGVICFGTWGLFRESFRRLTHAVPGTIDADAVRDYLLQVPGVQGLHELHVWAISSERNSLSVHLVCPELEDADLLIDDVSDGLSVRFGIRHVTIQVEREDRKCRCRHDEFEPEHEHAM